MIKVNLIPEEERRKIRRTRFKKPTLKVPGLDLILAIIFLVGAGIAVFVLNNNAKNQLATLENNIESARKELKRLEKEKRIVENTQKRQKELSQWVDLVKTLNKDRSLTFHLLDQLNRLRPDYMWFVSFSENGGHAEIRGKTFSNLIISNFMIRLRNSAYYSNVKLEEIEKNIEKEQEVLSFVITSDVIRGQGG